MKKKDWLLVILPLIGAVLIDYITKRWASQLSGISTFGPFSFILHHNHGAMLGLFSDLPSVLRVVSLSTGGAFILSLYAFIQYMLPIRSMTLRYGLSLLTGGILGNVVDRILYGYVIDFIVIGSVSLNSPAFNLADAIQWVGYALIIKALIRDGQILWPDNDVRSVYWINRSFQLKFSFLLVGIGLSLALISMVYSYTYLRVTIADIVGNNEYLLNKYILPFMVTFLMICLIFCAILFSIAKYISHRIAGPIYAFERTIRDLMAGKNQTLRFRSGDEFKHLEVLAEDLRLFILNQQNRNQEPAPPLTSPDKNACPSDPSGNEPT